MVERSDRAPQNTKRTGAKWLPVVDVLRQIEDVEEEGGGRFADITRKSFPKNSSGLNPRIIPYTPRGSSRSDDLNK